jgi:hypothetical protein
LTPSPSIFSCSSRRSASAVLAVAVAVIAAGCGGNSPSSASSSAAAAGAKGGPGAVAYQFSACMRHHGVTNFPDPKVTTSGGSTSVAIGINPSISGQPAFKSAQKACSHILPQGRNGPDGTPAQRQARTEALIAFARCLRAHGFPNFPDPDASGQLSAEMITKAGVNFHTPALLAAGKGCASVTHGQITPAQVAAAINHATASSGQGSTTATP